MADYDDDSAKTDNIRIVGAREAGRTVGQSAADPEDDPFASWFEPGAGALVKPVTASVPPVGASQEEFHLPDWTAPPTGMVPRVVGGDATGQLTTAGPVFRGSSSPMSEQAVDFDDLADAHLNVGALKSDDGLEDWDDWADGDVDAPTAVGRVTVADPDPVYEDLRPSGAAAVARPRRNRDSGTVRTERPARPERSATAKPPADDDVAPVRGPRPRRRPQPPEATANDRGGGTRSGTETRSGVGGDRNLGQAAGIGVGLILIGALCFITGPVTTLLLVTVVIGAAAWELVGALHKGGYNPAGLIVLAGTLGLLWGPFFRGPAAYPYVLGLIVITTLMWFLVVHPGDQPVMNIGATLFGTLYVGGLGSFAALMAGYPNYVDIGKVNDSKYGIGLLVAAIFSAVSYDVAGYFVGRSFGATPLGPTFRAASPNKTQEGLIGGIIVSIVVTFTFLGLVKLPILGGQESGGIGAPVVALLALGCAFIAPLGDLCESMIKRDLDVKDMSQTLPGHGGILDRFDALLFVLPVAYFLGTAFGVA